MSYLSPPSQRFGRSRLVRPRAAFRLVGPVIVAVHTVGEPSNEEWEDYIRIVLHAARLFGEDMAVVRQILVTDGGGPNPAQRAAIVKATEHIRGAPSVPRAVISSSKFVRGIVTALNWLDRNVKLFTPEEVDQAIAFLGLEPAIVTEVWEQLSIIDEEMGPIEMIRSARQFYKTHP
jgi:hypothetical protein